MISEFIGIIFQITSPIVVPFGIFMRIWIDYALQFFPADNMTIYITIFIVLMIAGFIVNIKWSGKEKELVYKREEGLDAGVTKCKYCGKPLGDSEFCPYCGSRN